MKREPMRDVAIYYFSATGNSLAAAQELALRLDAGDPISIPGSLINTDPYQATRNANAVGFVFPVQRATIPQMLRGFIEAMPISPNQYYFAVSTYSLFGSNEFWDIDELLGSKGALLNSAAGIRMMGNVGLTNPSSATISRRLEQMRTRIAEIALAVSNRQENYFPRANKLLGSAVRSFTERRRKNIAFNVGKHCRHCGICALVCPAHNISIPSNGSGQAAPVRSDKCEACLACVHWCPAGAIGTPTHLHTRYHNPTISPEQLNHMTTG
jgi:ferredoxin/flavodoxin